MYDIQFKLLNCGMIFIKVYNSHSYVIEKILAPDINGKYTFVIYSIDFDYKINKNTLSTKLEKDIMIQYLIDNEYVTLIDIIRNNCHKHIKSCILKLTTKSLLMAI